MLRLATIWFSGVVQEDELIPGVDPIPDLLEGRALLTRNLRGRHQPGLPIQWVLHDLAKVNFDDRIRILTSQIRTKT
jgi:hypothetical protein